MLHNVRVSLLAGYDKTSLKARNAKFEMITYGVTAGHRNTVVRKQLEPFAS